METVTVKTELSDEEIKKLKEKWEKEYMGLKKTINILENVRAINCSEYFRNIDCKYYPCHNMIELNCLFCFCPLYNFEDCLGTPKYTDSGKKDCSDCEFPHKSSSYKKIIERLKKWIE
jgi:iron complex transport system ATP-binding protein